MSELWYVRSEMPRKIIEIMKNILEEIAARTRERIAKEKSRWESMKIL